MWDTICAAAAGDVAALRRLLERDPNLYRAEYWYTQPIHFAVREGHLEAVQMLLDAGADPAAVGLREDLVITARDRGHEAVARLLEEARGRRGSATPAASDHAIHLAAAAGDLERVRELLDADPQLVHCIDRAGGTPLHRAVAASRREMVELLLDRGADIHALHGAGPGSDSGYAAAGFQPIDLALWNGPVLGRSRRHRDRPPAHRARGDLRPGDRGRTWRHRTRAEHPGRRSPTNRGGQAQRQARPVLRRRVRPRAHRPAAARPRSRSELAGSDRPRRGESPSTPRRAGNRTVVEWLLDHGADPNGWIDSAGSATYVAASRELRALLFERGGTLDAFDLVWLGEDDEVRPPRVRRSKLGEYRLRRSLHRGVHAGQA